MKPVDMLVMGDWYKTYPFFLTAWKLAYEYPISEIIRMVNNQASRTLVYDELNTRGYFNWKGSGARSR